MLITSLQISRLQAFLIHLGISFLIFLVLAYLIVFHWYPIPFFYSDGGWQGIRIIAAVDLVLGPLLTLIVFKPGKPGLKFDLSLIAFVQIAALTWGTWITFSERPVAVVYSVNHFTPVTSQQLKTAGYDLAGLHKYGDTNPVPIYVELPEDLDARQKLFAKSLSSGVPLFLFIDLYQPFDEARRLTLRTESDKFKAYLETEIEGKKLIQQFSNKDNEPDYLFIPLHSRYHRMVSVIDPNTLEFIANLELSKLDRYSDNKTKNQSN